MKSNDNADLTKRVYLECACTDYDHMVRVSLWDWNDYDVPEQSEPPELVMEYRVNQHQGLWARICTAWKYIWGTETMCYHDVILDLDSANKLSMLCRDYHTAYDLYKLGTEAND
jgi:hypothetical protein